MGNLNNRIECDKIVEGVMFTQPVYFDDGKNMFLASRSPAKKYHITSLKRWNIPYLLTSGKIVTDEPGETLAVEKKESYTNVDANSFEQKDASLASASPKTRIVGGMITRKLESDGNDEEVSIGEFIDNFDDL